MVTGAVVGLLGLASILSFADHLMVLSDRDRVSEPAASSVAYVGAEGMLVVAEALAVVLFTALSAALLALRNQDRKSTRLNSSHLARSRMPSSA